MLKQKFKSKFRGIFIKFVLLPLLIVSIFVTVTAAAIQSVNEEIMALFTNSSEQIMLMCEGTYTSTGITLHIWSVDNTASTGEFNSESSEDVINGACDWARSIAHDDSFHYGYGDAAHHNGCYFCKTQPSVKHSFKQYEKSYCCNPFVHAAFAHGGGEKTMLKKCKAGSSYDFHAGTGYDTSSLFKRIYPKKKEDLQPGDVMCKDNHVALALGNNQYVQAGHEDDNNPGSERWNSSIAVSSLKDSRFNEFKRFYRYIGKGGGKVESIKDAKPAIDFTVSASKTKSAKSYELILDEIQGEGMTGSLNATAVIDGASFSTIGYLFSKSLNLTGSADNGKINGSGYLMIGNATNNSAVGKATYVGVDDTDTEFSRKILSQTAKWSNSNNPYYNGYGGHCEAWTNYIYTSAGVPYRGSCCAFTHCKNTANKTGAIPKGALVFSGRKPDGTIYQNNHRATAFCDDCGNWAGHIGIYIGNGIIVGSQIPYAESVDTWIDFFGYGGWATY